MDLSWWNLIPTYFDGTAIELGNFPVRWYGIMYIFAFLTAYITMWKINKKEQLGYTSRTRPKSSSRSPTTRWVTTLRESPA